MRQVDEALGELRLREAGGSEIKLGDLWRERTAVLVWLRHYR